MAKQTHTEHLTFKSKRGEVDALITTWDDGDLTLSIAAHAFSLFLSLSSADACELAAMLLDAAGRINNAPAEAALKVAA